MFKLFYTRISSIISGNPMEFNVEKRLFNIALFISVLVSLISISINLQLNLPEILHYIIGSGTLLLGFIYIRSRLFKKYHTWLFIWSSLIILSGSWIYNEGPSGSINYIYILAFIVFLSITNRDKHILISFIIYGNLTLLYLINYLKPEWIHPYATAEIKESDLLFTYLYVIVFAALIFSSLRRNYQNEKNTVEKQKVKLEKQHKLITDSILYAKEIQKALIQNVKGTNEYFKDYFIFYKPKDIVSGDFYLFEKVKDNPNKTICIVSDCTGHGVPGALLTVLGISLINEIIHQKNNIKSSDILNQLRKKIISTLGQDNSYSENRDGMDMSVCIIDKENNTLEYSGANRPLYLIRNKELFEYKPNRMPVSVYHKEVKDFTHQTINLLPNDTIYLFTDGYADQFNDTTEQKFLISNLKKLLIDNSDKSMTEQQNILSDTFYKWKGNQEQTDDVLIVGFKPILKSTNK